MPLEPVERKVANSGNVEYANPETLRETGKSRLVLVPFFIRHSDHTELSIKLQVVRKANPPETWSDHEEKSISLDAHATEELANALQKMLAVAGEDGVGNYITLPLGKEGVSLEGRDPAEVARALISALSDDTIAQHISGVELGPKIIQALRYSVRLEEMKSAMSELRMYLDGDQNDERVYQKWCEAHPWSFGNQFVVNDSIRNISTQDQVDILVPRINAGFRDIIELKRPDMEVLKKDESHRDFFFSRDASKAIGQCHRYLDVFSEVASKGLLGHEEIVAYHPNATIVIGRSNDWESDRIKALHGLNSRLNGIRVVTYDYLLAQGDSLVSYLSNEANRLEGEEEENLPF